MVETVCFQTFDLQTCFSKSLTLRLGLHLLSLSGLFVTRFKYFREHPSTRVER